MMYVEFKKDMWMSEANISKLKPLENTGEIYKSAVSFSIADSSIFKFNNDQYNVRIYIYIYKLDKSTE